MHVTIAEVKLDLTIGCLHVCQAGRDSFVYDLMEPYRPQVDREVLAFVQSETFTPRDFVIDTKGVCRLHPQLAQQLVSLSTSDQSISRTLAPGVANMIAGRPPFLTAGQGIT